METIVQRKPRLREQSRETAGNGLCFIRYNWNNFAS
jgi:hypothetical protein